ncbi:MAG: radical SAM protein [Nitrospirota bacterium]
MLRYKEIFLGGPCNNSCLHCSPEHKNSPQTDLASIITAVNQKEEDNIALFGGEPAMRSDILTIIQAAVADGYRRIKLITNGRAFSDVRYLHRVLNEGCSLFEIKLWGPNPSVHDYLTQAQGSFWETIQGLENLTGLSQEKFVCVRIPVCKENFSSLENTLSTALTFGINRIILSMQDYSLPLRSVMPHIANAINISIFNRVWIMTEGIPFCIMQGIEQHVGELLSGLTGIYERTFQHHKHCVGCVFKDFCPGTEERYLSQFGDREFASVTAYPYLQDMKALYA